MLNALLLPLVLGFLYRLARTVPPESLRLQGGNAGPVALAFVIIGSIGLYAAIAGLL